MFPESTKAWTSDCFELIWNFVSMNNPGTVGSFAEKFEISGSLSEGRGGGKSVGVWPGVWTPGCTSFFGYPASPFLEVEDFHYPR